MVFPLAAIGAGFGQFAQDYAQQQAQHERSMMLQMQLANFKRQMDADARDADAARIAFGPGLSTPQPAPIQGLPQAGAGAPSTASGFVPPGAALPKSRARPTEEVAALINQAAAQYNVDPTVLTGLIGVESNFSPTVTSPKGAQGLAQLMPGTATELGVTDPFDIKQAIPAAARYLRQGLDAHGGDINRALMYYHGGPDTRRWGPITRAYPDAVLGRAKQFGASPGPAAPQASAPATAAAAGPPDTPASARQATLPDITTLTGTSRQPVPGPGAGVVDSGYAGPEPGAPAATRAQLAAASGSAQAANAARASLEAGARAANAAPAAGGRIPIPPTPPPTDYSRPAPAVAPPPGAQAQPAGAALTGTGAVPPGGTQVAQAAPSAVPAIPPPRPPALPKSKEELLQEIFAQYPGVDGRVARKAAIDKEKTEQENYKVRVQDYQAQLEAYKLGPLHQQQRGERIQDATAQAEQLAKVPARKGQENITLENGVTITGFPATGKWTTLTGEPLTPELRKMLSEGRVQTLGAYGAGRKAEQIELTDPATGKVVFEGLAHETSQNKWTSAADGRVLDTAGLKLTRQPPSIGVTSQNVGNRISMGANEVARAVENMTAMPLGTTLGWFGGAQSLAPRELRAGLQRSLANVVTPESAQMLSAMARGVERGLGILAAAGAATGLVSLQESLKAEIPQENDTGFTVLTKYANMRQLVEAANDTIQASNLVPETQKKQMQVNVDRITKAVPWTVADVIKLRTKPTDQSVADFAKKLGLGQQQEDGAAAPDGQTAAPAGAGGAQAEPPPGAIDFLQKNPSPTLRFQFDQKYGQGAADRILGAPRARTPMPPPSGPVFTAPIPPAQ